MATTSEFVRRQWRDILGVDVVWEEMVVPVWERDAPHALFACAWAADFHDPDNFLGLYLERFRCAGPEDPFRQALEDARSTTDVGARVACYGRADRILIEEAHCLPLVYDRSQFLVRPWVRQFPTSPQCWWFWKDTVIDPH